MEKINVLRLIFNQPTAHYRVGFTQMNLHRTLPLPPPSTLIGFIHRVMECKEGETIRGFDVAVCGSHESIFYHYQTFRKFDKLKEKAYKEAHIGVSMLNQVQLLNNVYLRIYLKFHDFDKDAPRFLEKINNPSVPFYIGRREDMAILKDIEIKPSSLVKKKFPLSLEPSYWVSYDSVKNYGIHGAVYLLGTYYKIEEGIRNFERRRFYYIEPQLLKPVKSGKKYISPEGWMDEDGTDEMFKEIPVFFLGINEPEQAI
jgi:CRISPR-associated protein Cas5t